MPSGFETLSTKHCRARPDSEFAPTAIRVRPWNDCRRRRQGRPGTMDFRLTPEQEMMRDSARRLVERTINPLLDTHDRNRPLPKSAFLTIFEKLDELGLPAIGRGSCRERGSHDV